MGGGVGIGREEGEEEEEEGWEVVEGVKEKKVVFMS